VSGSAHHLALLLTFLALFCYADRNACSSASARTLATASLRLAPPNGLDSTAEKGTGRSAGAGPPIVKITGTTTCSRFSERPPFRYLTLGSRRL
jgi:hypothetical protein